VSTATWTGTDLRSVYVGKYKGRKVAVSEFREHLSESEYYPRVVLTCLVDIRELKLLAEFSHPNIVKFVCPGCTPPLIMLSVASAFPKMRLKSPACSLASCARMATSLITL
jgi:hypothetical protein